VTASVAPSILLAVRDLGTPKRRDAGVPSLHGRLPCWPEWPPVTARSPRPASSAPVDLTEFCIGIGRSGTADVFTTHGPPLSIEGLEVGLAKMTQPPPHSGERHPDGDELLVVLSGEVEVLLEEPPGNRSMRIGEREAFVVPQGVWHRVVPQGTVELLYITPGPNSEHRPLS
jgi:mannose-6-phosphate isomerase-like protein (cupin superfamily)